MLTVSPMKNSKQILSPNMHNQSLMPKTAKKVITKKKPKKNDPDQEERRLDQADAEAEDHRGRKRDNENDIKPVQETPPLYRTILAFQWRHGETSACLLVAQGFDRVETRRPHRGVNPGNQSNGDRYRYEDNHVEWVA
jgi:hypothetical protein